MTLQNTEDNTPATLDGTATAQHFKRALAKHQAGNLAEARADYMAYLAAHPQHADTLHLLGILAGQQGEDDQAEQYILQALRLDPKNPSYHNNLAKLYKRQPKQRALAYQHLQTALSLAPNHAPTLNLLGIFAHEAQRYTEAIDYYQAALLRQPGLIDARYNLATSLIALGDIRAAKQALLDTLTQAPNHAAAHQQLAQLYHHQDNSKPAMAHYQACLKHQPQHVEARHQLAALLVKCGAIERAITQFRKVIEQQPDHPEVHANLGAAFLASGQPNAALPHYLLALRTGADDPDLYYNIGVLYLGQDRFADAEHYFTHTLKLAPKHSDAMLNLGALYLKQHDSRKAAQAYRAALNLEPTSTEIQYILSAIDPAYARENPSAFSAAPDPYIRNLFNEYAPHFEQHLLSVLQYTAHQQLHQVTEAVLNEDPRATYRILDLGCGTGLCGPLFKPMASTLVGVDLSEKMIEQAAQKGVYDQCVVCELYQALNDFPDQELLIAADVLPYLGDLTTLLQSAYAALRPGGYFAFTLEKQSNRNPDYTLQTNARYAHSLAYLERLCQPHWQLSHHSQAVTRSQQGQPVLSYIIVLKKPTFPQ